jgi:hypothetical protein
MEVSACPAPFAPWLAFAHATTCLGHLYGCLSEVCDVANERWRQGVLVVRPAGCLHAKNESGGDSGSPECECKILHFEYGRVSASDLAAECRHWIRVCRGRGKWKGVSQAVDGRGGQGELS